jgi:hypothetical protein
MCTADAIYSSQIALEVSQLDQFVRAACTGTSSKHVLQCQLCNPVEQHTHYNNSKISPAATVYFLTNGFSAATCAIVQVVIVKSRQ